jgi:uncharacterized membrane protein
MAIWPTWQQTVQLAPLAAVLRTFLDYFMEKYI